MYAPQTWATGSAGRTPLSADRLNYMENGIAAAHALAGGILLDAYSGSDDEKLDQALATQKATPGMPPVVLGERKHVFNRTRELYSGLKLVGARPSGPKNLELASSGYVPSRITLGPALGSARSSWWVAPDADVYDVFMADFAVSGDTGRSVHQFIDFPVSSGHTLYACEFRSLSFDFMRAVFGRKDRPCALTQVVFSGHWTALNLWETQFTLGGSDCSLWMGGQLNVGNSASPRQTGRYQDSCYQVVFSSLSKTNVGYMYVTALNGWRGLKITGNGSGLFIFGGTFEGYKPQGSAQSGPAPGTVVLVEGGSGAFYGPTIGQGMSQPDRAEKGLVQVTGGEWSIFGATFLRGSMPETVPCVAHLGGRLTVSGITRAMAESWSGRPRYTTTAKGTSRSALSFSCADKSMSSV